METALLLIAGFRGIFHGIQTWLQYKDRKRTKEVMESIYEETLQSESARYAAEKIISIVPKKTIELLRKRVMECYKKFDRMVENEEEYFEEDLNKATKNALPACICKNLGMIIDIAGDLPDYELNDAWKLYKCKERQKDSFIYK